MNGDDTQITQAQPDIDQDELARLRAVAQRFGPLASIADALEADPSKIYALQAALEGRQTQQNQQAPQTQNQQLTPEQIQELNRQASEKPAETMAAIAQLAMRQARQEVFNEAAPLLGTTASLVIESFKNGKAASDSLYRQILPYFEKELSDVGLPTLIGMDPGTRMRTLNLRWDSAAAQVFRRAAAEKKNDPPVNQGASGAQGAGAAPKKAKDTFLNDLSSALGLTQEEMDQINKELEEEG